MKIFFAFFSILLLVYLLMPGPSSVNNFPPLPNSAKSTLSGDTWQVPNISAYFSNNYRDFASNFYKESYKQNTFLPFSPFKINHPPEHAFTAIKDQTHSTYLEEFYYPLRDSLYVNGLEPYEKGQPRYNGATKFEEEGGVWETKVTLRYYPSSIIIRLIIWFGILISIVSLWRLSKRVIFNV
jgi:hypothetical protein